MSIQLYVSFLLASLVLVYSPGPVNVLTMSQALSAGWRAALPCVWGGTCAVLVQLAFTALCLNSLLLAATFALIFAVGVASTAVFSHRLRTVLQRPKRLRAVNRLMGSLLVGMGALMAAVR